MNTNTEDMCTNCIACGSDECAGNPCDMIKKAMEEKRESNNKKQKN